MVTMNHTYNYNYIGCPKSPPALTFEGKKLKKYFENLIWD